MEYSPKEYPELLKPILDGQADVVYGSRLSGGKVTRAFHFWHYFGNKFLTFLTNVLYNCTITDMETCYKVFRAPIFKNINIKSNRFEVRAGNYRQGNETKRSHLRTTYFLLWQGLCRRQKDHLERRFWRHLGAGKISFC